ncbi:hypothetical protein ACQP2K_18230 [Microbispora siamensis]
MPGLTVRYGRYTVPLRTLLQTIALALGGRAGARLTHRMMVHLTGDGLEQWTKRVQADDLPELHSFGTGRRRDFDAAT